MMKNAVEVKDLVVRRGGREVLKGIGFTIEEGSVTGLLGPSGCGKSTLMRALVGVQQLTSGSVRAFGEEAGTSALRSRIGYVTQAASVYDDLTVAENLTFFAKVLGVSGDQVDESIEAVDLGNHADQVVGRLSGGQRSRASLAVALLGSPDLLVLDEPTVGLDPVLQARPLEAVPRDRGPRRGRLREQPRDGRGRPLRPADADARGRDHRRRHPRRDPREDPDRRHRERLPLAGGETGDAA